MLRRQHDSESFTHPLANHAFLVFPCAYTLYLHNLNYSEITLRNHRLVQNLVHEYKKDPSINASTIQHQLQIHCKIIYWYQLLRLLIIQAYPCSWDPSVDFDSFSKLLA